MRTEWRGFKGTHWLGDVNVRDFIQNNYTPYDGDASFLAGPTEATDKLWGALQELQKQERAKGGVLDMETEVVSGITAYKAAYISNELKDLEKIVGLQTDKPLKRAFMPYGGIKMAQEACTTYGYTPNPKFQQIFNEYHKTHNQGVFDAALAYVAALIHAQIVQAGDKGGCNVAWAQCVRYVLLYENMLQDIGKLCKKGLFQLLVRRKGGRSPCGKTQGSFPLHAAVAVVESHFQDCCQVEPGSTREIGCPVWQAHLAAAGPCVVAGFGQGSSLAQKEINDLLVVHELGAAAFPYGLAH